jgi:hypothetical protein
MNSSGIRTFFAVSAFATLQACATAQPTTGLNETAMHTGTVTMLRVDDAWAFEAGDRRTYLIGDGIGKRGPRFVPLRFKEDIAGLDGPDRIVTPDDLVTLNLKSGFIKHFRDAGCAPTSRFSLTSRPLRGCKGEVAIVLSFDDDSAVKENLLIYSARGQTLGSPLALDDWPIVGPVKITGDRLLVRLVVLELDRVENERAKQIVTFLTNTASTVQPELGPALKIAQQVADALINTNTDDVIVDKRFSLARAEKGSSPSSSPLLFGKYILVQQEDELADRNIAVISPHSRNPLMISEMRYDRASDRVYRIYPYKMEPCPLRNGPVDWSTFSFGSPCKQEGKKPEPSPSPASPPAPPADEKAASPPQPISEEKSKWLSPSAFRQKELGCDFEAYDYTFWDNQDEAFYQALYDSCRSLRPVPVEDPTPEDMGWTPDDYTAVLGSACANEGGGFRFEYPAVLYPEGNTLLAQYPLHTHIVFSIERSTERTRRYDEQFKPLATYLDSEVKAVQDSNALAALSASIKTIRDASSNQETLFRLVQQLQAKEGEEGLLPQRKVCQLLIKGLRKVGDKKLEPDSYLAAPVFNEIFHLTGYRFSAADDVAQYLDKEKQCKVDRDKDTCECPAPKPSPKS